MKRDLTPLLNRMCEEVPAATTAAGFDRNICVLSTRVAVDSLRQLGYRARPLACKVAAFSPAYRERANQLGRLLEADELEGDVWSVGVDISRGDTPGKFNGHVIAIVDERYGLDLTLDQVSRPQRGINLRPAHFPASRAFLRGDEPWAAELNGTVVQYEAMPDAKSFLKSGDWTEVRRLGRLNPTPRVVRALAA